MKKKKIEESESILEKLKERIVPEPESFNKIKQQNLQMLNNLGNDQTILQNELDNLYKNNEVCLKVNEKFIDDFVIQYKNEYNDDFVPNKETNESNININKNINNNIDNEKKEDNINNINIKDDDNNNIIIDDNNLNINEIREINNKKQNYN